MKLSKQANLQIGLVVITLSLVFLSSMFMSTLAGVDYFIQGLILISVLIIPIVGSSLRSTFGVLFLLGLIWGIWRIACFDPVTKNDIPGIGYLIAPVQFGIMGLIVYSVRKAVIRFRHRES